MTARILCILAAAFFSVSASEAVVKSTPAGGKVSSAATWEGGKLPGDRDSVVIAGPVVLDGDLGAAGGGIGNLTLDGEKASLSSDGAAHRILFASTGNDPIDVAGGGKPGAPGPGANMFGITQKRGSVELVNVAIAAADGKSPVYIRNQVIGAFPADLVLRNCAISNLGTPVGAPMYAGIAFWGAAKGFKVEVEGCTFRKYYRLLVGKGTDATLLWKDNNSFHATEPTLGAVYILAAGFTKSTVISGNVDDLPDAPGMYVFVGDVGNAVVVERNAVRGSKEFRRGLYKGGGSVGAGNGTFRNNLAVNSFGAAGTASLIYLTSTNRKTDLHTVVEGNVATGCYESIALRPLMGKTPEDRDTTTPTTVCNNWLSEDYDMWADQGVIMIGGTAAKVRNNIIVVPNSGAGAPASMGFFAYAWTTNLVFDRNTVVGVRNGFKGRNLGVTFGEGGYPICKTKARSNLVVNWDWGILDMNHLPSESTYDPDPDVGTGVHHNATFGCAKSYADFGSASFRNPAGAAHPDAKAYGDLDGVDPQFLDATRTPFTYDKKLGGDGTCRLLFEQLAAHKLGANPVEDLRQWLFDGYAPTNPALHGVGYQGSDVGAVDWVAKGH